MERLTKLAQQQTDPSVKVGFLSGATYPDGTPVPEVAAYNEFGVSTRGQPPRPFFRNAIAENKNGWSRAIAANYKATDYDVEVTLDRMGQLIKAQIQESIRNFIDPPLAPSTVVRKGFSKALIDTAHMLNSVDYEVTE
jgi:hypothetical protein